jgi:KipI family sensor histidine kinase inhibitor
MGVVRPILSSMSDVTVRPAGDAAFLVQLGSEIDERTSQALLALSERLRHLLSGVPLLDIVPAYHSLLVSFRPGALDEGRLFAVLEGAAGVNEPLPTSRTFVIPVKYGGEEGPDLDFVADVHGLSLAEVVRLHSSRPYRIYCLGFSPGFPYLGGLPPDLVTPRLATPRARVPAGSVGIGGGQTGVYPAATPGGWRIVGRTPLVLFDAEREPPVAYRPGDFLRFQPISSAEFTRLLTLSLSLDEYAAGGGR